MALKGHYNEFCNGKTCNTCETCIYDEGNLEDIKNKNNNNMENQGKFVEFTYAYCNQCPHAIEKDVMTTYHTARYVNWFCGKTVAPYSVSTGSPTQRTIEMSALSTKKVSSPYWCPFKTKGNLAAVTAPKSDIKKPFKDLSYTERRERWTALKPINKWDDIIPNQIYHLPPIIGEPRKDIFVTSKSEYSLCYRNLTKGNAYVETYYPTSIAIKFLVPHKIKDIKVVQK